MGLFRFIRKLFGVPPTEPQHLSSAQRVSILLYSLDPALRSEILERLPLHLESAICREVQGLSSVEEQLRRKVLAQHLEVKLDPDQDSAPATLTHLCAALEVLVRSDLKRAALVFEVIMLSCEPCPPSAFEVKGLSSGKLTGNQRAAILFMTLPPELSAILFQELQASAIHSITLEITQLPPIVSENRHDVICQILDLEEERVGKREAIALLERRVKENPKAVARLMMERWLESHASSDFIPSQGSLDIESTQPTHKAAIVFMTLPPELCAEMFSLLGPEEVQVLTLAITQLAPISLALRHSVVCEFLDLDEKQIQLAESPFLLARVVSAAPGKAAQLLTILITGA